ncbi:MAG TPA: hypothetical protein VHQ65_10760 [Thermoanaerobaculia bacterium]|nr:hypothetical protein [Thermoanaerobaculia bacterium]
MPHGSRLRATQPLIDRDGSCPAVYDLERARLVEVPEDFRFHAAQALEAGNLDDALIGWLAAEDLLTYEAPPADAGGPAGRASWAALPDSEERRLLGATFVAGKALHCHPPRATEPALRLVLARRLTEAGCSALVVHLSPGETVAGAGPLGSTLRGLRISAELCGAEILFRLHCAGAGLEDDLVQLALEQGIELLVPATAPPALVRGLLARLPSQVTLVARLDTGQPLRELWRRARELGAPRLDATKVADAPFAGLAVFEAELREYRRDLFAVADEMLESLAGETAAVPVFEPLARAARRHLAGRGAELFGGPAEPPLDPPPRALGGLADCSACWAAALCGHGPRNAADGAPHRPAPRADRCELWRAEAEVALLLVLRLEEAGLLPTGVGQGRGASLPEPFVVPSFWRLDELEPC